MTRIKQWIVSAVATVASTYALDAVATVAGLLLVASALLAGVGHGWLIVVLVISYTAWGLGLWINLRANSRLLAATGTSTNVLSKAAYDLTWRRTGNARKAGIAAAVGYTGTEIAKEVPYYAGAFGAAVFVDSVTADEAVVFLIGANLGAALYEYGLARLTVVFLRRRRGYASFDTDWVPADYLADYYLTVEPDEMATVAFLVDAMRHVDRDQPVLYFGVGPTLHHVFAAADVASEIHLGDYLEANLAEIRRWLDRDPGAHDWRPFVRYTLRCEGIDSPSDAEVEAREDLVRKKVVVLIRVDARDPRPIDRDYPTVISAYCADSATADRGAWESYMRHITGLVRPGGHFVTAALRRCRRYTVAGLAFPSPDVDEHDLRALLRAEFVDDAVQVRRLAPAAHGYSSIMLGRARRRVPRSATPGPALVGAELTVPLVTGGERRYVNLDYAASAPCLVSVQLAVNELLPWYSSVHRGAGYKSQLTTEAYEDARAAVGDFVGARDDDVVVFTRNTTDSINLLASALPPETEVIAFAAEHHANLLPWRRRSHTLLPLPASAADALDRLQRALSASGPRGPCLVTVTGASNVTGEIWPYAEMARLAHDHGARLLLDAAQLAPHRRIDMAADGIDYLAMSGHKLYAPFGAGALVGRPDWLGAGEPFLAGGGAVRYVGTDTVLWADLPDRQEAGSPNVVGAVALGAACRTLQAADRSVLEAHETRLIEQLRDRLAAVPGIEAYRLWAPDHPRIAVLPFALHAVPYALLAAVLSAEFGIGVRHGCFCAHPLMTRLLKVDAAGDARIRDALSRGADVSIPGAVRASIGIGTTVADCDRLVAAVTDIAAHGPRWTYTSTADGTDCRPTRDPRRRPAGTFTRPAGR